MPYAFSLSPVEGIGEVHEGDDLAALLAPYVGDGDVLVVTSKVVSKAEGRVLTMDREAAVDGETVREVARRGRTRIVRNRLGLTMAAAGVDASNTTPGTVVLLPLAPDSSARRIREALLASGAGNVAVLVSDTSGRAWRDGQTDLAIGAAGIEVADDHAGRTDPYGNPLVVTLPATADEIAGAAEVAAGKLSGVPAVVVRGLAALVLPPGEHGPGAATLVRAEQADMFGLGAREAVMAAVLGSDAIGFGRPAPAEELAAALARLGVDARTSTAPDEVVAQGADARVPIVAFAHGWTAVEQTSELVRLRPHPTLSTST